MILGRPLRAAPWMGFMRVPARLGRGSSAASGNLAWDAVAGADGYTIHRGTTSGVYTVTTDVGSVLMYPIASLGLSADTTYYLVVRAYDEYAHTTWNSNEIQARNGVQL